MAIQLDEKEVLQEQVRIMAIRIGETERQIAQYIAAGNIMAQKLEAAQKEIESLKAPKET